MSAKSRVRTFADKLRKAEQSMGGRQPVVVDCPAGADYDQFKADIEEQYADHDGKVYLIREEHLGATA